MSNTFDDRIKRMEQEIEDIKTARQHIMGATSSIQRTIPIRTWAISQEYGIPYAAGETILTIHPENMDNGFIFNISQPPIRSPGDFNVSYYTDMSDDGSEFVVHLSFNSCASVWTPAGEKRQFDGNVTLVASGECSYTIEYKEFE